MTETVSPIQKRPPWVRMIMGRSLPLTLVRAAILGGLLWVVFTKLLLPVRTYGISMEPSYKEGSVNLINRLAYLRESPKRGDVVAIRFSGRHVMLVKRIVGMPGEQVQFRRGQLFINGEGVDEPYLQEKSSPWNTEPEQLKGDEYFVVGDNRSMSSDLHVFGVAKRERILGKAVF